MEKSKPPPYNDPSSAPGTIYPKKGYPPPQTGSYLLGGQQPPNYTQESEGYQPHPAYQTNLGYQPQAGYPTQQVGYQTQHVYQQHPAGGNQPQQGFPQSGYVPPLGYLPKPVEYTPPQPFVPRKPGLCEDLARNKPQSNSLAAATFIFMSGGMSLAWSVTSQTGREYVFNYGSHVQICWFIAVIIGACLATLLINRLTRRIMNLIAAVLVMINGLILVCDPDEEVLMLARYCDGIAFGLTIIPAIVAGSEQSVIRFRGMVLSLEHVGLVTGMVLKTSIIATTDSMDSCLVQGILSLIFGFLALAFAYSLTIETASFYLRKNMEPEAISSLRRLQLPQTATNETYAGLYENKHLLEEDAARGLAVNIKNGLMPMIKLCLYRAFISMSYSVPLTWAFMYISYQDLGFDPWNLGLYAPLRMIGIVFAMLTIDRMGRKILGELSLAIGGFLLIAIAILFSSVSAVTAPGNDTAAVTLLMVLQIFAGIAAPSSTCYLGEAFSVSVKPFFILVAVTLENTVQILCCSYFINVEVVSSFAYALGIMQIAFSIIFFVAIPETKNTTLRQALAKFQKCLSVGST